MKAATLASLLVTSAAAGAAAAGGPFFFAQTTPKAVAFEPLLTAPGQTYSHSASVTLPFDFVVTDLTCAANSYTVNYAITVNGSRVMYWNRAERGQAYSNGSGYGYATAASVSFADGSGIPVPAGSTLTVESSVGVPCSLIGYHY